MAHGESVNHVKICYKISYLLPHPFIGTSCVTHMALSPARNSYARAASALRYTAAGAAMSLLALAFPAAGQEVAANCGAPTQAGVQCAIRDLDRRIDANIQRGIAADIRRACMESLMAWAQSDPRRLPQRIQIVNGIRGGKSFDQVDSCEILNKAKLQEQLNNG